LITESGMNGMPEEDLPPLLGRAAAGDAEAWRSLVKRYGRRLFALAKSRCHDPEVAEDITQSVFATVVSKLSAGEYAEEGKFESWLFRVAMNRIRDHIRRVRRQPVYADSEVVAAAAGAGTSFGSSEVEVSDSSKLERLREAVQGLSDADREVIELRHHGGMSFKQMADVLEEPLGTLLARHHRALRKLKEVLEGAGPEPAIGSGNDKSKPARAAIARRKGE